MMSSVTRYYPQEESKSNLKYKDNYSFLETLQTGLYLGDSKFPLLQKTVLFRNSELVVNPESMIENKPYMTYNEKEIVIVRKINDKLIYNFIPQEKR